MVFPIRDSLGLSGPGVICLVGAGGKTSLMFGLARELAVAGSRVLSTTTTNVHFPSKDQSPVTLVADTAQNLVTQSASFLKEHRHLSAGSLHVPGTGKLKGFAGPVIDEIWHTGCFDWVIVEADGSRQLPIKASDTHEPVMPSATTAVIHVTGLDALNTPLDDDHVHRSAIFSRNTGLAPGSRVDIPAMTVSCVLEIQKACALAGSDPAAVVWLNKADDPRRISAGHAVAARLKKSRQDIEDHLALQRPRNLPHFPDRPLPWPGRVVIASLTDPDPVKGVVTV
ncbi:MAG: putative selenium-dependent hydroxylase accessory protein YqeC [Desulfotignum sp.]|nr:putative selenium-dependent hydroxylase accessory protein YqeC [Desulfotignum sp.]